VKQKYYILTELKKIVVLSVYYKFKRVHSILFSFSAETDRAISFSVEKKMSVSVAVSFKPKKATVSVGH